MLQVTGKVVNVFTVEGGKDKDGKEYPATHKVQLMGEIVLPNGDSKYDLMDLKVDDLDLWHSCLNKEITVPVGAFSPSKGSVILTLRKGAKPVVSV